MSWFPFEFVDRVFAVMGQTAHHTFQVLTKRPERMRDYMLELGRMVSPNVWLGTSIENSRFTWRADVLAGKQLVLERATRGARFCDRTCYRAWQKSPIGREEARVKAEKRLLGPSLEELERALGHAKGMMRAEEERRYYEDR